MQTGEDIYSGGSMNLPGDGMDAKDISGMTYQDDDVYLVLEQ